MNKNNTAIVLSAILIFAIDVFASYYFLTGKTPLQLFGFTAVKEKTASPDFSAFSTQTKNKLKSSGFSTKNSVSVSVSGAIMRIGQEMIFQSDFEIESKNLAGYDSSMRKIVIDKLVWDSKFLQMAKDQGLVKLDESIFNSGNKNYEKRLRTIQDTKNHINRLNPSIKGVSVYIWFLNDRVGPLGYEKAKSLAYSKIKKLHEEVRSGEITIEQAAEKIKSDTSLSQLDPSYKTNAFSIFDAPPGKQITWEPEYDKILWGLDEGALSDIYTGKSYNFAVDKTSKFEAFYVFSQIKKKIKGVEVIDINSWYNKNSAKYEVEYL